MSTKSKSWDMPVFAVLEFIDFLLIGVIVLVLAGGSRAAASVFLQDKDELRLRRLERKLDLLLQHAALPAEGREELQRINAELQVHSIAQKSAETAGEG